MSSQAQQGWLQRRLNQMNQQQQKNGLKLYTPRLVLRPPLASDAKDFFVYASDPKVARFVLWDAHQNISQSRRALSALLAASREEGLHTLAIALKDGGRMVGTIGLVHRDRENQGAEVGFSLAQDCWGQGLMSEALSAYLGFCFMELKLQRVEALHDSLNPASGRVMEKCGMKKEGILRRKIYYKGRFADLALYAALREEWLRQAPASQAL